MKIKTLITIAGLALGFSVAARAGEEASAKQVIAPVPAGQAYEWSWFAGGSVGYVDGDWDLGAVGDAIGLDDWQEPIYSLHIGRERRKAGENFSHAFFLEVGYTESDSSVSSSAPTADVVEAFDALNDFFDFSELSGQEAINDIFNISNPSEGSTNITSALSSEVEIIPITINYKFETHGEGNYSWYIGGGLGLALVDVKLDFSVSTDDPSAGKSEIGDSYSFDDAVYYAQLFAGLTYNFSDSVELVAGARYIFMDDIEVSGLPISFNSPLDGAIHYELGLRYNF
jgi:hypothetical protein